MRLGVIVSMTASVDVIGTLRFTIRSIVFFTSGLDRSSGSYISDGVAFGHSSSFLPL